MKISIADELLPATTEGGRAVDAFIKICPPADRSNLDSEWMEMCALFVKGWMAKAAEQSAHTDAPSMCPHGLSYDELCKPCGRVPDPLRASNANH